jgi:hypothetical protein
LKISARKKIAGRRCPALLPIPEIRQQLHARIFPAISQFARNIPKRIRTMLLDNRQKLAKLPAHIVWERTSKSPAICRNSSNPTVRFIGEISNLPVEIFLEARNSHIEAQNFQREAILRA